MASSRLRVRISGDQDGWVRDMNRMISKANPREMKKQFQRVHREVMRPLQRKAKALAPASGKPKRSGGNQPYANLRPSIRLRASRRNAGIALVAHQDAFHYFSLDGGTKRRYTKQGLYRGQIAGKFKKPSTAPWDKTGFVEEWAGKVAPTVERLTMMKYRKQIFEPLTRHYKKNYRTDINFILPTLK